MSLPVEVQQVTGTFLALVDEAAPDLVEGLYLHGSLGFGEFCPDRSDIDFVAVLSARPSEAQLDTLAAVHSDLSRRHPRPFFDGFHILREDLARPPSACPDVPCVQARTFKSAGRFDINPVTWHELARHGITVRGQDLEAMDVWTDDGALRAFTHANLTDYWAKVAEQLAANQEVARSPEAVEWCVLGVSRLHHLLATGELTSKCGAGHYALATFAPEWHPLIAEALGIREGTPAVSGYADDPARRGRDTTALTSMAVDAGLALGAQVH